MPAARKSKNTASSSLRIIGGSWRGSKISFAETSLRPTLNQVRETLFNWLGAKILDADCLDLFAGSGVHGLESISRGAASVTAVEISGAACQRISSEFKRLHGPDGKASFEMINADALQYLAECNRQFDLIFVDPPFDESVTVRSVLKLLEMRQLRKENGLIYFEMDVPFTEAPNGLQLLRQKKTGRVSYGLLG